MRPTIVKIVLITVLKKIIQPLRDGNLDKYMSSNQALQIKVSGERPYLCLLYLRIFLMPCLFRSQVITAPHIFLSFIIFAFLKKRIRMFFCCLFYDFEFSVFLHLYWLPPKARDSSLPCCLTYSWGENGWIDALHKDIIAKVDDTVYTGT